MVKFNLNQILLYSSIIMGSILALYNLPNFIQKQVKDARKAKQTGIELYVNRDINHDGVIDYVQGREGRAFISQPDGHFAKADIVRTNNSTIYKFQDGSFYDSKGNLQVNKVIKP